jgi:hypothetical protein
LIKKQFVVERDIKDAGIWGTESKMFVKVDTLLLMKCLAGGSLCVIGFAAFMTVHLLQEINQFYHESIHELSDFKVVSCFFL